MRRPGPLRITYRGPACKHGFFQTCNLPDTGCWGHEATSPSPSPGPAREDTLTHAQLVRGPRDVAGRQNSQHRAAHDAGSRSRAHSWGLRPTGLHTHRAGLQPGNRPTPGLPQSTHGLHGLPGQMSQQTFPECHQGPLVLEWGHERPALVDTPHALAESEPGPFCPQTPVATSRAAGAGPPLHMPQDGLECP